jgi:hypothetical protein
MPPLARRFLRTAWAFLAAGVLLGLWMLAAREYALPAPVRLRSAHSHLVLVGFVILTIGGVALWMFPRPAKGDTRYRPLLAEWAYWLAGGGTALRALLELTLPVPAGFLGRLLLLLSGIVQAAGVLLVFWALLPRIRSISAQPR